MCLRSGEMADKMRRRSSSLLRRRSLVATIALAFASLLAIMAGVVAFAIHEVDTTEAQRRTLVDELLQATGRRRWSSIKPSSAFWSRCPEGRRPTSRFGDATPKSSSPPVVSSRQVERSRKPVA